MWALVVWVMTLVSALACIKFCWVAKVKGKLFYENILTFYDHGFNPLAFEHLLFGHPRRLFRTNISGFQICFWQLFWHGMVCELYAFIHLNLKLIYFVGVM